MLLVRDISMTKLTLDNIDERLRQLEINIEKIILIQDNIQTNYLNLYNEVKAIRSDIKKLELKENEIETNVKWITKLKNYSLISGSILAGVYALYKLVVK